MLLQGLLSHKFSHMNNKSQTGHLFINEFVRHFYVICHATKIISSSCSFSKLALQFIFPLLFIFSWTYYRWESVTIMTETNLMILIYILWAPVNKKEWFLGCHVSAYMYVWMCTFKAPECKTKYYLYSVFKSLPIMVNMVNMNILPLKITRSSDGPL
jgi:hypothetical protein